MLPFAQASAGAAKTEEPSLRLEKGAPPVFLFLFIPLALGWILARHYLQENNWPALLSLSSSLAFVTTLVGVNFFYRKTLSLASSAHYTLMILSVALLFCFLFRPREIPALTKLSKGLRICLLALSALVLIYTNAQQIANPDDDYWIHAPLQGLMRGDNFPPFNPFFSDIPMNGHYGRNLSIVTYSYFSGSDVFMSQHVLTSLLQVITLLLFFSAFRLSSGKSTTALLGSFFVFFGINAGGRGGLIDTMQNNNAFVHLYLALLCYLTVKVWKEGSKTSVLLAGLCLGSYAIVYETHFGLIFFSILGVTPILWARKLIDTKKALGAFLILFLSLPLACTQGGPLTDLLDRKVHGRGHTQAENLSKGMQNQAQVVKVTFPKKELFQILLETGEYQRTSNIYRLDTPLKFLYKPSTERGYAYVWSWDVLKIHFLPLYLVPWTAFFLWRRGSFAGLFMGAFGTIAFLVPALVHFGPIYESEYYRWEFAASLGFAAALGLTLGELIQKTEQPTLSFHGDTLLVSSQGKKYILVALITLINSWACFHLVGGRLKASLGPDLKKWLVFPSTQEWLASHRVLNFQHLDYKAARWLEKRVKPGDRVLVNFTEENNFSILYESTLTGITGARCVGHALPLEDEKIGTTPFRRSPAAQLFWQTGIADPLAQLKVDWLFYLSREGSDRPEFPGARLVQVFKEGPERRLLYSVDQSQLPKLKVGKGESDDVNASLDPEEVSMRGGRVYEILLQGLKAPDTQEGTLEFSTLRLSDGLVSSPSENLRLHLESGVTDQSDHSHLAPFVSPYDEGEYELQAVFWPSKGSQGKSLKSVKFRSEFKKFLEQISIEELKLGKGQTLEVLESRHLYQPLVSLKLPPELPQAREVLACWAFYSEERAEFDLLPGVNLKQIELSTELKTLPFITPAKAGKYRLALYLSAGQGHLTRIPAGFVQVEATRD